MKKFLKVLARSKSRKFAADYFNPGAPTSIEIFGREFFYRPATSDTHIAYEVLMKKGRKAEYWVPSIIQPSVILDIGANIGASAVYFSNLFPQARILCFEPVAANYELLIKNTEHYPNIETHNYGLGEASGEVTMFSSDADNNFGGGSLHSVGIDQNKTQTIQIRNTREALAELNVKQIDLIKIDTEGAEFDILSQIDEALIKNTRWIIGELHGIKDFLLLESLSQHFDISVKKQLNKRLFMFNACNKALTPSIDNDTAKKLLH